MNTGTNISFLINLLRFTFLFVLFESPKDSYSQTQSIPYFKNYSDNQGFPGSTVFSISDDSNGFVWFCTDNGLYRFDGQNYMRYVHDDTDSTSIPGDLCLSVFLDSSDRMWVGCGPFLCLYNYSENNFTRLRLSDDTNTRYGITSIFEDNEKNIFCCSEPNALFILKHTENSLQKINPIKNSESEILRIKSGYSDNDGNLWLATYAGIVKYNLSKNEYNIFNDFPESNHNNQKLGIVTSIILHPLDNNYLLCGTWGNGLISFHKKTGEITSYTFQAKSPSNLNNIIFDIHPKDENEIWIASSCIGSFQLVNSEFHFFNSDNNSTRAPIQSEVRCIHADRSNLVWFGTVTGVSVTDRNTNALEYINVGKEPKGIIDLVFDPLRNHFYSLNTYDSRSLRILDESWNVLENIAIPDADMLLSEPFKAFLFNENILWIGTTRQGILTFDLVNKRFDKLKCTWPDGVMPDRIYPRSFCIDQKGFVWMCSTEYGLFSFNPETSEWITENDKLFLIPSEIRNLTMVVSDKQNRIWCLNKNHGLIALSSEEENCWLYENSEITDFTVLDNNKIAISGLQKGPGLLELSDSELKLVTEYDSQVYAVPNRYISVCEDKNSNLWFLHRNGLEKYNDRLELLKKYGSSSGLQGNLIETQVFYFQGNKIFIPFASGIYTLNIEERENDYTFKPVRLTSIKVNGKQLVANIASESIPQITLAHFENFVTFEFNSLEFVVQEDLSYLYKLEGNDEEWKTNGTLNNVNYSDLSYGEYTFKVKVVSPNGIEGPEHTLIKITIQPAWWQTWLFHGSIIIILLLLIVWLVRYFSTRKLRRTLQQMELQRGVEKVRNRIARDIHDEIGSGLTKISLMSSRLEESELTSKIQTASREIIANMGEIIWAVNPENDSLFNLTAHIRDVSGRFFEDTLIQITSEIPSLEKELGDRTISPELKRNIMLTLKEAFTNILKHSHAKNVNLDLVIDSKHIYLTIKDDGVGIPSETRVGGNGLINMEKRTLESGGKFGIISSNSGTSISLEYPLN